MWVQFPPRAPARIWLLVVGRCPQGRSVKKEIAEGGGFCGCSKEGHSFYLDLNRLARGCYPFSVEGYFFPIVGT